MAVRDGDYPFGGRGAHPLFERAAQVCHVMIELRKLVARAIKAAWRAVALEGGVASLVRALKCVFARDVPGASTNTAPFVFFGFGAVLGIVVEQEAPVTLSVRLCDGGRSDGDWRAEHGEASGAIDLLNLFPCGVNKDKRAMRLLEVQISERFARPVRAVDDAASLDRGVIAELSEQDMWWGYDPILTDAWHSEDHHLSESP